MDEAALMRTMGFASFGGGFGGYDDEGGGEGDAAYSSSLAASHDSSTSTRTSYTNEAAVPMSVEGASGYAAGDHAAHVPAHVPAHAPQDAHGPSTSAPVREHSPHDSAMGEAAPAAPASYYWPDLTRPMWGVVSDTLKVGGDGDHYFLSFLRAQGRAHGVLRHDRDRCWAKKTNE